MNDLIKRSDAIKAVVEVLSLNRFASFKDIKDFGRFAERMLRNVPSADRPQGEWIAQNENYHSHWVCSECGAWALLEYNEQMCLSNFCPNCGCRMKGADDD